MRGRRAEDELTADGHVYDTDRIMFLRAYLTQLQRATAEGVPGPTLACCYARARQS